MNATPHPLDKLIAKARDEIAQAERALERAHDRLMTLQVARDAVGDLAIPARRRTPVRQRGGMRRQRSLSEGWRQVLADIARYGEAGATLDQILGHCESAGLVIERQTLRSQMSNYAKRGYITRREDGVFRTTADGDTAAGIVSVPGVKDAPSNEGEAS